MQGRRPDSRGGSSDESAWGDPCPVSSLLLLGRGGLSTPAVAVLTTAFDISAHADLIDQTGLITGLVTFEQAETGVVTIAISVKALEGEHAVYLHETGDCEPGGPVPFASAGAHFNPADALHGVHAGDLGYVVFGGKTKALPTIQTDPVTVSPGPVSIFDADGSAIVIHADRDDAITDPGGNSGARVFCGVIQPGPPPGDPRLDPPLATHSSDRDVPTPAECQITPRTQAELRELDGAASGFAPMPTAVVVGHDATVVVDPDAAAAKATSVPSPGTTDVGVPADADTRAAVTQTVREWVACGNAFDILRLFALSTDAKLQRDFVELRAEATEESLGWLGVFLNGPRIATPFPSDPAAWSAVLDIRDVVVLPGGRVSAVVVTARPDFTEPDRTFIFVRVGARWLIDDIQPA